MLRLLCLPMLSLCLAAQEWADLSPYVEKWRRPGGYSLFGCGVGINGSWRKDYVLGSLGPFVLRESTLTGDAEGILRACLHGSGWALFSPEGERLGEGLGLPDPQQVRKLMTQHGWVWEREQLWAHLRQQPSEGQAWVALLQGLARQAGDGGFQSLKETDRERFVQELSEAVTGLEKVPELEQVWLQHPTQSLHAAWVLFGCSDWSVDPMMQSIAEGLGAGPGRPSDTEVLRDIQRQMARLIPSFQPLIRCDPEQEYVWRFAEAVCATDEGQKSFAPLQALQAMEPVPGKRWPPTFHRDAVWHALSRQPETLLQTTRAYLDDALRPELLRRLGRGTVAEALASWGGLHARALLQLRGETDCLVFLDELRQRAGSEWPKVRAALAGSRVPSPAGLHGFPLLAPGSAGSAALQEALQKPALPDRVLPPEPPLRLVRLAEDAPPDAWTELKAHPCLDAWAPDELVWTPLSGAECQRFRENPDLAQGDFWLLLKGEDLLATGAGLPQGSMLEATLRQQGTPRLDRLTAFLEAHPERLDGHRERIDALKGRLPHPRLERLLVTDLEALAGPIGPLNFAPDPGLWEPAAARVCARLAGRIRAWPFHEEAWEAYVAWSALNPKLPRPADLLSTLDPWPSLRQKPTPGPLPMPCAERVAKGLEAAGRWAELDKWTATLWDKGLGSWLAAYAQLPKGNEARGFELSRSRPLLALRVKALQQLGKSREREAFLQELSGIPEIETVGQDRATRQTGRS